MFAPHNVIVLSEMQTSRFCLILHILLSKDAAFRQNTSRKTFFFFKKRLEYFEQGKISQSLSVSVFLAEKMMVFQSLTLAKRIRNSL